jgi:hypothetical protein
MYYIIYYNLKYFKWIKRQLHFLSDFFKIDIYKRNKKISFFCIISK